MIGRAGGQDMHVRAMLDDKGRIMVIATTIVIMGMAGSAKGNEDGFFHEFSEKRAYPLGITLYFTS